MIRNLNIAFKPATQNYTVNTMEDQNQQLILFDTEQSSSARSDFYLAFGNLNH